jgi:Tfp pilus assembly protein PilO
MKGSDKTVVFGVVMAIILAAFYFKVVSPERAKVSSLGKDVTTLQGQVDQQKQNAQVGETARQNFPAYYGRLVVLGKAVPGQADTASLLVELSAVADRTHVDFRGLALNAGSGQTSGATPPPSPTPPPSSSSTSGSTSTTGTTSTTSTTPSTSGSSSSSTSSTASSTVPAPATEASAANLPLGAVVGSASLPTMPYDMTFVGSYFDVANFLKGVDDLVHLRESGQVASDGRLLTVDGFSLSPSPTAKPGDPNPQLQVDLAVTSYVTPSTQGVTAGASPSGPAPSLSQPQTQPASQPVSP